MSYIVTITTEDQKIQFKHDKLCNAIKAIEDAAETVEGFEDGKTEISLSVKLIKPLPV
jgi:hypothetical protein